MPFDAASAVISAVTSVVESAAVMAASVAVPVPGIPADIVMTVWVLV